MNARNLERGCDNMLLDQACRIPCGAVIDEYGAAVEYDWQRNRKLGDDPASLPLRPPRISLIVKDIRC